VQAVRADQQVAEHLLVVWQHLAGGSVATTLTQIEELGLGLAQLKTLDALDTCDGAPTVKDLGERLGLSLPGMSRNVDGLLRRGLVERREDERDRRMKRIALTGEGRAIVTRVNRARLEGLEAFTASLPAEQCERLAAALAPITEGLR
jgi:DNA-binding MarR family transcriptional regulator